MAIRIYSELNSNNDVMEQNAALYLPENRSSFKISKSFFLPLGCI